MEKEFVPYELAFRLKKLGFDEPCFGFWSKIHGLFITNTQGKLNEEADECLAPTFSQAFRWFREKYGVSASISLKMKDIKRVSFYTIDELDNGIVKSVFFNTKISTFYSSYEEAELACLERLIDKITNKKIFDFVTDL